MTKRAARAVGTLGMVVVLSGSVAAQAPAPMAAAVGSNTNHVPSFVGLERRTVERWGLVSTEGV